MAAYINPASVRVDVSDLMSWRDDAIRVAKEKRGSCASVETANRIAAMAVAATIDVICDGWKTGDDLMDSFYKHDELVSEEVYGDWH